MLQPTCSRAHGHSTHLFLPMDDQLTSITTAHHISCFLSDKLCDNRIYRIICLEMEILSIGFFFSWWTVTLIWTKLRGKVLYYCPVTYYFLFDTKYTGCSGGTAGEAPCCQAWWSDLSPRTYRTEGETQLLVEWSPALHTRGSCHSLHKHKFGF